MSLALIEESAKEVRRLAIAGSPLAVGDFRIKKLVTPLEQAGAKVPVFAQVAKAINDLANGTEAESAARLLALSTLLNAILYTQGQTSVDAPFNELEIFAANCTSTRTTARALKPLIVALTTAGAGRLETIRSACERGAFDDLRLIDPAIQALGDSYPEMADLVAEKILPAYGPGIVPRLKLGLDLKGKKSDARRVKIMHQLDPAGTVELCKTALDDGAPEVKAAAIACLGKHEEYISLILEQANAKNKIVRAAALEALAEHDRPEIVKLFGDLIKGDALEILARPFRAIRNRGIVNSLLEEGRRILGELLNRQGDPAQKIRRFSEILDCLKQRKDPEVEEFLLACFDQCGSKAAKKSTAVGVDLAAYLTSLVYDLGSRKALEALLAKREVVPPVMSVVVFRSALRLWPADKIYQEFSSLLSETKGDGKQKNEALQRTILESHRHQGAYDYSYDSATALSAAQELAHHEWDPRWLDAAVKEELPSIVCCLARPDHKGAISYLLAILETGRKGQGAAAARAMGRSGLIMQTLARCQHPGVTDIFLKTIESRFKGAQHIDYDLQLLLKSAGHLPPADLPKLDAFAAKLDEKFVDKYLEALEPLRAVNQPKQT